MKIYIISAASCLGEQQTPDRYARDLRRADDFIRYAVIAADRALSDTSFEEEQRAGCGLFLGSGYGPMETNFDVLDQVVNKNQTSPTLFSHSVFNAAAGYLARIFNIRGPALTVTDFVFPFFQAMQQAVCAIDSGRLSNCLVIQVETYSQLLADARNSASTIESSPLVAGGCALLLSSSAGPHPLGTVEKLQLETCLSDAKNHLKGAGQITIDGHTTTFQSQLDTAAAFCTTLIDQNNITGSFDISSPFGHVSLSFARE